MSDREHQRFIRDLTMERYARPVAEWSAIRTGRRPDPAEWEPGLARQAELLAALDGRPDDYDERPDLLAGREETP